MSHILHAITRFVKGHVGTIMLNAGGRLFRRSIWDNVVRYRLNGGKIELIVTVAALVSLLLFGFSFRRAKKEPAIGFSLVCPVRSFVGRFLPSRGQKTTYNKDKVP